MEISPRQSPSREAATSPRKKVEKKANRTSTVLSRLPMAMVETGVVVQVVHVVLAEAVGAAAAIVVAEVDVEDTAVPAAVVAAVQETSQLSD